MRVRAFVGVVVAAAAVSAVAAATRLGEVAAAPVEVTRDLWLVAGLVLLGALVEVRPLWWSEGRAAAWQMVELASVPAALLLPPRAAVGVVATSAVVGVWGWSRGSTGPFRRERAAFRLVQPLLAFLPVLCAVHVFPSAIWRPVVVVAAVIVGNTLTMTLTVEAVRRADPERVEGRTRWHHTHATAALGALLGLLTVAAVQGSGAPLLVLGTVALALHAASRGMERAYVTTTLLTRLLEAARSFHLAGDRDELEGVVDRAARRLLGRGASLSGSAEDPVVLSDPVQGGDGGLRRVEAPLVAGITALVGTALTNLELRERTQHLADHDELTGLPNRRHAMRHLEQALAGDQHGGHVGVVFLDVDGLKVVNDGEGHEAGDALLRTVAEVLRDVCRRHELAGRVGGDEFVVVIAADDPAAACAAVAARIRSGMAEAGLSASLGTAWSSRDGHDGDALLRAADRRMYEVKAERRVVAHAAGVVTQVPRVVPSAP